MELIKIHHDHIDHLDAVLFSLRHVALEITACKQTTMHARMKRLDAPVHHLRKFRDRIDRSDRQSCFFKRTSGTASRDDLNAKFLFERTSELDDTGLIGH